jgi:hypothetical protein
MFSVRETSYVLRPKSAAWRSSDPPSLSEVSMTVERAGAPLGGHNIQVVIGAPDRQRRGLNAQVVVWLPSGWWVTLRNQFADATGVAAAILESAADGLSDLTTFAAGGMPRGARAFWEELVATTVEARGPDYWR